MLAHKATPRQPTDQIVVTPAQLEVSEELIKLAQLLQQDELADGVIQILQKDTNFDTIQKTATWSVRTERGSAAHCSLRYEKKGEWDKALAAYQLEAAQPTLESRLHQLLCLENTQQWSQQLQMATGVWRDVCVAHAPFNEA